MTGGLLLGVALVALVARVVAGPCVPIHTNGNGISELRTLAAASPDDRDAEQLFGPVYPAAMEALFALSGRSEMAVYRWNQVCGSLAAAALVLLALVIGFSPVPAVFAGLAMALHPSQVWLSSTESSMALFQFLLLASLAGLVASIRRCSIAGLWAAMAVLTIAATLRVLTAMALPISIVLFYVTSWRHGRLGSRLKEHFPATVVAATGILIYHFNGIRWVFGAFSGLSGHWSDKHWSIGHVLFDPTLTPPIIPVMAAAGAAWLLLRRRQLALLLLPLALLTYPAGLLVNACRSNAVRYQTPTHWVLYLLAAAAIPAVLAAGASKRSRGVLAGALLTCLLATAAIQLTELGDHDLNIREYQFIRQASQSLPPGPVRLPALNTPSNLVRPYFPDYATHRRIISEPDPELPEDTVYLGLFCYWHLGHRGPDYRELYRGDIRKECLDVCPHGPAIPVRTLRLSTRPPPEGDRRTFHKYAAEVAQIGFFRCPASP